MHAHGAVVFGRTLGDARSCPVSAVASSTISHPHGTVPVVTQYGMLPLHVAVECKASAEVVQAVLAAYPDAVKEKGQVRLPAVS